MTFGSVETPRYDGADVVRTWAPAAAGSVVVLPVQDLGASAIVAARVYVEAAR